MSETELVHHLPSQVHGILTPLDPNDRPGRPDTFTEEVETASGTAPELHNVPSWANPDLTKQPRRFVRQLLCLHHQSFLFGTSVTEHVLFVVRHLDLHQGD